MNKPAEQMTNGAAQRRSRLYRPGAMNAQTWYRIQGAAMKIDVSTGSFTQMMLKASIGATCTRAGGPPLNPFTPSVFKALTAGAETAFHNLSQNVRLRINATPTPPNARRIRERNSSRWSRNDMRSIPPSSPSPSESDGGGGLPPPEPLLPDAGTRAVDDTLSVLGAGAPF